MQCIDIIQKSPTVSRKTVKEPMAYAKQTVSSNIRLFFVAFAFK